MNKTAIQIKRLSDESNDFEYWQSQSYLARLVALEEIRTEYNTWKYGAQSRFQRVCRVIKLKPS